MADAGGDLNRFTEAQKGSYGHIVRELKTGQKLSHWMWYIFPQITGLGHSATARFYAIQGLDEARAYKDHPILGQRLLECAGILLTLEGKSARDIFGEVDAMKLRSSMTLFAAAAGDHSVFQEVIDKYFYGEPDQKTLEILTGG